MLVRFANLMHGNRDDKGRPKEAQKEKFARDQIKNPFDLLKAAWNDMKTMGKTIAKDFMEGDIDLDMKKVAEDL